MKCPECQNDMVRSQKGWLCLHCGHVQAESPHDVALIPPSEPTSVPASLPDAPPIAAAIDSSAGIVGHSGSRLARPGDVTGDKDSTAPTLKTTSKEMHLHPVSETPASDNTGASTSGPVEDIAAEVEAAIQAVPKIAPVAIVDAEPEAAANESLPASSELSQPVSAESDSVIAEAQAAEDSLVPTTKTDPVTTPVPEASSKPLEPPQSADQAGPSLEITPNMPAVPAPTSDVLTPGTSEPAAETPPGSEALAPTNEPAPESDTNVVPVVTSEDASAETTQTPVEPSEAVAVPAPVAEPVQQPDQPAPAPRKPSEATQTAPIAASAPPPVLLSAPVNNVAGKSIDGLAPKAKQSMSAVNPEPVPTTPEPAPIPAPINNPGQATTAAKQLVAETHPAELTGTALAAVIALSVITVGGLGTAGYFFILK